MLKQALITGTGIFIARAFVLPLDARYQAWKASRPEIILKRNWRGKLVQDLTVKRLERAVILFFVALFALACAVSYTIMSPTGPYATSPQPPPGVPIVRTVKVE